VADAARVCRRTRGCGAVRRDSRARGEGIVLKRRAARYESGRRSGAWVKRKHRRRERLVVTGWMPAASRGELDVFLFGRREGDRTPPAGNVALGLTAERRAQLRAALERLEVVRRGRARRVHPAIAVDIDHHGRRGGLLRDGVMRAVHIGASATRWPLLGQMGPSYVN
jgi:ATP-dependent DNA ligase